MARAYSRKKGKSNSTRPVNIDNSEWTNKDAKLIKQTILDLAKDGKSASEIGMILRDQYGVTKTRVFGKKLNAYLKEVGVNVNPDLDNAEKKVEGLKEHLKENITDRHAKHKLQHAQSRLNITRKYFARKNKSE